MTKPRTVLGPGILSAALILSACGSPDPRAATVITTGSVGVTAAAIAPISAAASARSSTSSEVGSSTIEHRSGAAADAA
ncbi:hypothetical protein [Aquihabitans sp. McL0605]|uniref:hypothetical protein n=1 Tax=Aquihabitans sp. McL0605 TaxID=3415671 RepID=UPI003CE988E4